MNKEIKLLLGLGAVRILQQVI